MQYLLSLLPYLICPLAMGLVMWFVHRSATQQPPTDATHLDSEQRPSVHVRTGDRWRSFHICLDWRLLLGIGAAGGLLWFVSPGLLAVALPLLALLACPLSMLLMLRHRIRDHNSPPTHPDTSMPQHALPIQPPPPHTPAIEGEGGRQAR